MTTYLAQMRVVKLPDHPRSEAGATDPLREALEDLWSQLDKKQIDDLCPETVEVAQANHERLCHAEGDRWSSATSTMTAYEVSVPYEDDDEARAITRALGVLSHQWVQNRPVGRHMEEGRGVEPPGVTPPRYSTPVASHLAVPSEKERRAE